jgi:hypothetical protein
MLDSDKKIKGRQEVVLREEDDGAFLFDPDSGRLCYLNAVGITIWRMCGQPIKRAEIVDKICKDFPDIPEKQVSDDCAVFLGDLDRLGFIA